MGEARISTWYYIFVGNCSTIREFQTRLAVVSRVICVVVLYSKRYLADNERGGLRFYHLKDIVDTGEKFLPIF